jgi:hypothetical protein
LEYEEEKPVKVRTAFVSNSSSSSFIITTAIATDRKDLQHLILKAFKVPQDSPLYRLASEMAREMANEAKLYPDIKDYCEEEGYAAEFEVPDNIRKIFATGRAVYMGRATSEGEWAEVALCDTKIMYTSEELTIEKKEGY